MINSKIEWTHHTLNLWNGCSRVHTGCLHCYAQTQSHRYGWDIWGIDKPRRLIISAWDKLDLYQKLAAKENTVHRVFVGSMQDIFERPMPLINQHKLAIEITTKSLREQFFENITVGMYSNLDFLLLTKRPSNINKYIPEAWKTQPPSNVMFGTSPVDQATANILIRQLAHVNGRRFLSVEPQLDQLTLLPWLRAGIIDWVIVGGESGAKRRPFNPDWGRQLRDECGATGVPFFFKQIDKVLPIPEDLLVREFYKIRRDYSSNTNK